MKEKRRGAWWGRVGPAPSPRSQTSESDFKHTLRSVIPGQPSVLLYSVLNLAFFCATVRVHSNLLNTTPLKTALCFLFFYVKFCPFTLVLWARAYIFNPSHMCVRNHLKRTRKTVPHCLVAITEVGRGEIIWTKSRRTVSKGVNQNFHQDLTCPQGCVHFLSSTEERHSVIFSIQRISINQNPKNCDPHF